MTNWREDAQARGVEERPDLDITIKKKKPKKRKLPCKALECLICTLRFSLEDILDGTYNLETFVCSYCYAELQQKPHVNSCFGKPIFVLLSGKRELGYDPNARDCRDVCPDRIICQRIVRPDLAGIVSNKGEV